jgi:hypothetical protein
VEGIVDNNDDNPHRFEEFTIPFKVERGHRTFEELTEAVNKPPHYNSHPSGIECIAITEHMNFCLGNAIKYIWRAGLKTPDPIKDLKKALWYIQREINRIDPERKDTTN